MAQDTSNILKPFMVQPMPITLHSATHAYSYRVPSPPRIVVPPPALNTSGVPDLNIDSGSPLDFESNGFANSEFLKSVTYGDFMIDNVMLEWRYPQRQMAQAILPFLYLGPFGAARDQQYLQREGFTMVLAVRNTMSAQARLLGSKVATELGIQSTSIDVAGNQELIAAFPRAIETINSHLSAMYQQDQSRNNRVVESNPNGRSTPGKVLVFCESGNERSAAVVAAYIMAMYSKNLIEAIQLIQARRFCVNFDDSLKNLLQSYGTILQAKRDVAQYEARRNTDHKLQSLAKPCHGKQPRYEVKAMQPTKRTIDSCYDVDMDMDDVDDQMDEERFEKREGYAPFQDRHFA